MTSPISTIEQVTARLRAEAASVHPARETWGAMRAPADQVAATPAPAQAVAAHAGASARTSARALTPGRTPAGILVAFLLSVGAWSAVADLIVRFIGGSSGWIPEDRIIAFGARVWADPVVTGLACVTALTGIVLVALAVKPGRPRLVPLNTSDSLTAIGLTRSGMRRTLAAAARTVDGADGARVTLRRRRIEVTVITESSRTGGLLPQIGAAVGDRLVGIGAQRGHEVVVRVRPKGI